MGAVFSEIPQDISARGCLIERREKTRIPGGSECRLSAPELGASAQQAAVVDVSFGGAALVVEASPAFPIGELSIGQEIDVRFPQVTLSGVVTYVLPLEPPAFRLGVGWVKPVPAILEKVIRAWLR